MVTLKNNTPVSLTIDYDIDAEDSKVPADISAAKFFLAQYPDEPDDKYLLKTFGSGLSYAAGVWTVQIDQGDMDNALHVGPLKAILAIQYVGDTDYREPDVLETGTSEPLKILVEPGYSS